MKGARLCLTVRTHKNTVGTCQSYTVHPGKRLNVQVASLSHGVFSSGLALIMFSKPISDLSVCSQDDSPSKPRALDLVALTPFLKAGPAQEEQQVMLPVSQH